MKQTKILLFVSFAAFILFITSCSKSNSSGYAGTPAGGSPNSVSISGMAFSPSSISVKVGTTVTWKNNDGISHTVTSDDGTTFNSGTLTSGSSFSYTTKTAGTFGYHCNFHSGMTATLVVTQ